MIQLRLSAATEETAGRLRQSPLEIWLAPQLLQALRPRTGQATGREPLQLEISDRAQLAEKAAGLRQAGIPGEQIVVARLIEKQAEQKYVRLILLAETLDGMQKIAIHPAYLYQDHMLNQAKATLSLRFDMDPFSGRVQKVKAEGISLAPELQNRGLGGQFFAGVRAALQTIAPGALISGRAQHPAAAWEMALQYQAELVHPDARITALRSQKASPGGQPSTDLMYLLVYLKQKSEEFSVDPDAYTAWAEKYRLPEKELPREMREAPEVQGINLFLFEQFMGQVEVMGRIPTAGLQDNRSVARNPGGPDDSKHSVGFKFELRLQKKNTLLFGWTPWPAVWKWAMRLAAHWQARQNDRAQRTHPPQPRRSFLGAA